MHDNFLVIPNNPTYDKHSTKPPRDPRTSPTRI